MIKNLLLTTSLLFTFLTNNQVFAQNIPLERCGTDNVNEKILDENPALKKIYLEKQASFYESVKNKPIQKKQLATIIEIPVVVHLLDDGTGKFNLTEAQVNAWIDRVNSIFDATATDIVGASDGGTSLPFRLVLAKRTPDCNVTNGIVTHDLSMIPSYVTYGIAYNSSSGITAQMLNNSLNWDKNSYYNIYVTNMFDGIRANSTTSYTSGFAYYPGQSLDMSIMLYDTALKPKDTVLAHEFMHALNIKHVFGSADGNGKNCPTLVDDNISDTQITRSGLWFGYGTRNTYNQYQVYPDNNTVNDCTPKDKNGVQANFDGVQHNMMNYGSKLNRFTVGQANTALAAFNTYRTSLLTSKALIPVTANELKPLTTQSCIPQKMTGMTTATNNYKVGMENVKFGTINNSSSTPIYITSQFYFDYTKNNCQYNSFTTEVLEGTLNTITLTSSSTNKVRYEVYIDFNDNGIFETEEHVASELYLNTVTDKAEAQIYIPTTAIKNKPLRMRIIADLYSGTDYSPCGNRLYGEVEDYNVIVKENTNATIWNGTSWSKDVPTIIKDAIITGHLELTTNIKAKSILVESGSVVVKSGSTLTLQNGIVNFMPADKFIIENGANIIQTTTTANIGDFTVYQNSTPMILNDATFWSSPVTGQNVRDFSPKTLLKRFYTYNESLNGFSSLFVNDPLYPNTTLQNPETYNFINAKGYHIRVSADQTQTTPGESFVGKFIGKLNNGAFAQSATIDSLGYNLIGNPYPSSIDADKFLTANPKISTLHFWTHQSPLTTNGYASNNYASYNLTGGTNTSPNGIIPNGIISKAQGFIAQITANSTLNFNNTMRVDDNSVQFFKQKNATKKIRIWFDLYEGAQYKNQILIGYLENATNGYDTQMDAEINAAYTGSALYSIINDINKKFDIQGRAIPFDENDVVKLGLDLKTKNTYHIKLNKTENFDESIKIYLKDKVLNTITDITTTDYSFEADAQLTNNRFEIIYLNTTLSTNEVKQNEVIVYKNNEIITVKSSKEIIQIDVYDLAGRKIISKTTNKKEIQLNNLPKKNQVLVLKILTNDKKITNTKIIY
ncbi:GEVED domain-containing protein [Algoriella sp.]|uniref:GEVED domain-containing protein n=1 Tax=Algoriella sp. TaxID=1872434 RepID=UPI001B12BC0B|nr:GEVED domain-containing protein [Algoriella sp.]MBO6213301.1 hypothetical protein [Algoriella sp.]